MKKIDDEIYYAHHEIGNKVERKDLKSNTAYIFVDHGGSFVICICANKNKYILRCHNDLQTRKDFNESHNHFRELIKR